MCFIVFAGMVGVRIGDIDVCYFGWLLVWEISKLVGVGVEVE